MIPPLDLSGLLPPYVGADATMSAGRSPYRTTLVDLVTRFGGTAHRRRLLQGLLDYRDALRVLGITHGCQWVGGSFMEDCERQRGREPQDIDLLTFIEPPPAFATFSDWQAHIVANEQAFAGLTSPASKSAYGCDAYFLELYAPPMTVVASTHYWFGLFSHSRGLEWKGLVEIPLAASSGDDAPARAALEQIVAS